MTLFAEVNVEAIVDLRDRPLDHARHHLLGLQARDQRRRLLRRGPPDHRPPERPRDLRRLPLGRLVPRHRRPDLPLRLRRVPVLDRLPRRLPHRDVPARRAHAQRGQVHDRRRAQLPPNETPARAAAALGTFAVVTFYLIAQMVGAGVLIQALVGIDFSLGGDPHRHFHALLRRLRRHGGHDVGADRQGRAADGRHPRDVDLRAGQGRLQPDRAVQPGRGEHDRRSRRSRSGRGPTCRSRWTPSRSAWRSCSAPPACRTS